MAASHKRRKLEHSNSDDDDTSSFASFDGASAGVHAGDYEEDWEGHHGSSDETDNQEEDTESEGKLSGTGHLQDHTARIGTLKEQRKPATQLSRSLQRDVASTSSRSNTFQLQVNELLQQLQPKHTRREAEADNALHALKRTIESIRSRGPYSIQEAQSTLLKEKIAIPFPNPKPAADVKYKFEYTRPSSVNVVGSYALKTASRARESLYIDMVVHMPSSLFQGKDYVNHRYFHKRAFYLACVASGLQAAHGREYSIKFQNHHDDPLRPVVVVRPTQSSQRPSDNKPISKWQISILPAISQDVFPAKKLVPSKNSVRTATGEVEGDAVSSLPPTPFYNSAIRADMLATPYLKLLNQASKSCDAFRDACILGSTWLRQRGFRATWRKGGFGSFEWSALLAILLQGGGPGGRPLLNERYSNYQLFKATLQLLATKDLVKQPLVVGSDTSLPDSLRTGFPVIWDAERAHNILSKLSPWSFKQLQIEAKTTLAMLGDQHFDGFEATFIWKKDIELMRSDCLVEFNESRLRKPNSVPDYSFFEIYNKIDSVLRQGLGNRIRSISISADRTQPWDIGSARPTTSNNKVRIGMVVHPENVKRSVDHGPSAEQQQQAADFRRFWGEKAELRRFRDGSILESLVWSQSADGPPIVEQIIRLLLERHLSPALGEEARIVLDPFDGLLRSGSSTAAFTLLAEAFKRFESDVRNVEGLPLPIRQMAPSDAQLRNASVVAPGGVNTDPRKPASVALQFESSGRWPDNVEAIQRTKIAFLLRIGHLLQEAVGELTANVGIENDTEDVLNQGFLDVVYDGGAAFRVRVYHDREQTLLERQLKDNSLNTRTKESLAFALAKYKRDYIRAPSHTQAIAQLCSRNPALSATIRMLKKWLGSHLLANHIAEEVAELVAARTFVQPWPWQAPSSVQTGFARTLAWLARWDWRFEPLIVDLSGNNDMKSSDYAAIQSRFEAWRKLDPALNRVVLFAASNVDPDGTTYTDGSPSKVIASRLTALARAALTEIETQGLKLDPLSLFASPLGDYDFILHLNARHTGAKRGLKASNGTSFKNLELEAATDVSNVGFEPMQLLLSDLETTFGSVALFFSGIPERNIIAGLWNPQCASRSWKLNLAYSTIPVKQQDGEGEIVADINKPGLLAEIARLGGDLVKRVELNKA